MTSGVKSGEGTIAMAAIGADMNGANMDGVNTAAMGGDPRQFTIAVRSAGTKAAASATIGAIGKCVQCVFVAEQDSQLSRDL